MHIFNRKSSTLSTSHALAWHTTSRSRGLMNMERSQNVGGSGAVRDAVELIFQARGLWGEILTKYEIA